jgi:hypothetical protein
MECRDAPAERPRPTPGQALSRSLVALDQNGTITAVVELSQSSWLVGGMLPGIERQPCKKLEPSSEPLLALLHRWRDEAVRAGRIITRIALAFEAGRDGFWLARSLEAALPVLGAVAHDRRRIGRRQVPAWRDVRRRPLGRNAEGDLDFAHVGGEAGTSTHASNLAAPCRSPKAPL